MQETTKVLHSILPDPQTGAISTPIYQTSTFVQEAPGVNKGFEYSRSGNPTRKAVESAISELEHGAAGFAFASGLAAVDSVLRLLETGDEVLAVDDIYGGTFRLFEKIYKKLGIKVTYVDTTDLESVLDAISSKTKLLWLETPTNPTLKISDIKALAGIAHSHSALLVVDNTFASPVLQKPISLGADIVVHSGTKYIAGHSDVIAGFVVTADEALGDEIKFIQNATGSILGPWDCWLTLRGIQTLHLRIEKQCENAFAVARYLCNVDQVEKVYYPGLKTHDNHELASKQQSAFGAVVTFRLKEDTIIAAERFVTSTKLFKLAESLGGVKSLLSHPASMTHKTIPVERRQKAGISDSLIRLSFGIESPEDLIYDLANAFKKTKQILSTETQEIL